MAFDPMLQRQIMGRFATGVTVVTTRYGEQISGMTANAVMSLSLDPPLIVVSVDCQSNMHGHLTQGQCYAINVLKHDQEELSRRFAKPGPKDFSDLKLTVAETGAPIFVDALAYVDCRVVEVARPRATTICSLANPLRVKLTTVSRLSSIVDSMLNWKKHQHAS